ncbi:MAG: AbiV family abortive infection protein [Deltaproteobacteria bacterium]|nr:AbiV family abortive infection protein [Deltaproteobacteria bacterium]
MRAKAIKDLAQLSDNKLFEEVAEGLTIVLENAACIEADSIFLADQNHPRSCEILRKISEEETAKFLILMDAIRSPRQPASDFANQLARFNDHFSKGFYAEYYTLRLANFGEVLEYIKQAREEYFLDGPNDVDWIFRNRILQQREERIYVDYVENDGEHYWHSPKWPESVEKGMTTFCKMPLDILNLAKSLNQAGCASPKALSVIASKWRSVKMTDDFPISQLRDTNYATLQELDKSGLLREQPQNIYDTIINYWLFPLYSADLRIISVDQSKLREIQRGWAPEF